MYAKCSPIYRETYIRTRHAFLKSLRVNDTELLAMATAAPELRRMRLRSKTPSPSTAQTRKRMRAKTPLPCHAQVPCLGTYCDSYTLGVFGLCPALIEFIVLVVPCQRIT